MHADELGDTFSDDMVERIAEKLGQPGALPARLAGRPRVRAGARTTSSRRSRTSRAGTKATIVRLAEHDGDLLHWFYDQGLEPGRELEVRSTEPFAVQLNGGELALERQGRRRPVRPPAA